MRNQKGEILTERKTIWGEKKTKKEGDDRPWPSGGRRAGQQRRADRKKKEGGNVRRHSTLPEEAKGKKKAKSRDRRGVKRIKQRP